MRDCCGSQRTPRFEVAQEGTVVEGLTEAGESRRPRLGQQVRAGLGGEGRDGELAHATSSAGGR